MSKFIILKEIVLKLVSGYCIKFAKILKLMTPFDDLDLYRYMYIKYNIQRTSNIFLIYKHMF